MFHNNLQMIELVQMDKLSLRSAKRSILKLILIEKKSVDQIQESNNVI